MPEVSEINSFLAKKLDGEELLSSIEGKGKGNFSCCFPPHFKA